MKRYIVLLALCVLPLMASAQEESKKTQYLPEAGEFSIGVDVAPLFKFVGNLFNSSTDNGLDNLGGQPFTNGIDALEIDDVTPDVSIMGKYMLTDEWAVRANIGVMVRSNKARSYVADDADLVLNPLSEAKLIDQRHTQRHGFSAMLGAEYRKGSRRIQGVFGAGLLVGCNKSIVDYTYANAVTNANPSPSNAWDATTDSGYRILKQTTGANAFFGIAGNVGVEWFVAPKVALGAEVNLALYYVKGAQQYVISEGYNHILDVVEERCDIVSPGNTSLTFGTDNLGGSLYMSFYF